MNKYEALARLKYLVSVNQFTMVTRRSMQATAVTRSMAKIIVQQLQVEDFKKYELDRDRPGTYLWVFKTEYGDTYYLKFKFLDKSVKFISFHLSN
ncbi:type II toxin-antitoxin system MqsR family toxin [Lactiplantibacillus songbeiensis]|uniref:Type II toxin-antitoxin system MqsR family toxin n=1 Tax=Lactiplantibacillus songbeiensis TaxID=2559920 RepID=A0ABW4C538_9LACO|nr:type II toxin-antitoxin system MqsR family toxin [Lactiplantibacillus songbeiensis]